MTTSVQTITESEEPAVCQQRNVSNNVTKKSELETAEYGKYKWLFWEFETPIIWVNVFFITLWHAATVYFTLTFDYSNYGLIIYFFVLSFLNGFGVTAGAHRYYTHRCYKAKLPLRIILVALFTLAGQNTIIEWVKDHKVHHKYTETMADPHNAKRGFFFSHVGWLMMKKHPEVIRKGKEIDFSYLYEDPLVVFQHKHSIWLKPLLAFVIPSMIPPLLYEESWIETIKIVVFMRYIFCLNGTWSVNSFAHFWGDKPYDKGIKPVENLWVSFFSVGEGYHNYHHTFPWDYRAAELGSRINFTTMMLNFFYSIGWAYDLKFASSDMIQKIATKKGDGTHYRWGHEIPYEEVVNSKED